MKKTKCKVCKKKIYYDPAATFEHKVICEKCYRDILDGKVDRVVFN